ncbi:hypothetical protein CDA63_19240 [Hymenobacter amundsenii]|uniref:Glycosyltransferase subfamily 4-like N-terminal domain-containing protein n=1 Tax=Hymenobacter amundsenii TaxID=2006685 RepID=A0A246FG38_9BACT|nr:glycosyltransferase [Hymenobacter amundsenii]OWP61482.1 hypothetical protein CDA63_19240 [Hymenobacter amundsenii]
MTENKTILMLIPQLSLGGAERVFHDQARELARAGHRVIECIFEVRSKIGFPTENQLVVLQTPEAGASPLSKLQTLQQRVKEVKRLKEVQDVDVCISHLEGADYVNLLSKGKEQVILCVHNSKRHDPNYRGGAGWVRRRLLMPLLYRRADYVVTVSRDLRQELIDYFQLPANRVIAINNFLQLSALHRQAAEPLTEPAEIALFADAPVLIAVGRLDLEKNPVVLLSVLAGLRQRGSNARLVLVGDGTQRSVLEAEAQRLKLRLWNGITSTADPDPGSLLPYDVLLLGFRANPFQYVVQATISLLPSLTEGFPMVLCEALACGIPVASADCPTGPREILAPDTAPTQYAQKPEWAEYGLLLPILRQQAPDYNASVSSWVDSIATLLNDTNCYQHYVSQATHRGAIFGPKPVMAQWEQLLRSTSISAKVA